MQNTFEIELDKLLKEYFGDDNLCRFNLNIDYPQDAGDGISEKINEFYRDQLQIEVGSYAERIKIDRTITFSEKRLEQEKFCRFLLNLGKICISDGKLDLAAEIFRKANRQSGNITLKAESLLGLADVLSRRANWSRSLDTIAEARMLYKQTDDKIGTAKCENLCGSILGEQGDIESAQKHFLKSLSLINPEVDLEIAANLETNLGIISHIRENSLDSLKHLNKALMMQTDLGNYKNVAEVNLNIGMVHLDTEKYELAIAAFDEGIKAAKQYRFIPVLCLIYLAKSKALIEMNEIHDAVEFVDKALEISHSIDDKLTLADIYKVKGIIERHLKNYKVSESYLLSSLRINKALKNEMNIAETYLELAVLNGELKDSNSKDFHLRCSLSYYREINAASKVKKIEEILSVEAA